MTSDDLFSDNTKRLPAVIDAGGTFTTFGDFTTDSGQIYRVRSLAVFGGSPVSAMYLYRYNGVFDAAKIITTGEGLICAIEGGSGYINPIRYLMYPQEKLAFILGAVAPATGVRINVELEYRPDTRR